MKCRHYHAAACSGRFTLGLAVLAAVAACNGPPPLTKGSQPVAKASWLIEKGTVLQLTGDTDVLGRDDLPGETRSTRMPDMVALSDDCWLVVYIEYASPYKRSDRARLVVTRTADAGKTWETQVLSTSRKGDSPRQAGGSMAGGVALIVIGGLLFANTALGMSLDWLEQGWPMGLVLLGAYLVYASAAAKRTAAAPRARMEDPAERA